MSERQPGVYVDGMPMAEVDFSVVSDIDVVDIVGVDTELNLLPGADVQVDDIHGLKSIEGLATEPAAESAHFIPPTPIDHPLRITTITGTGSLVLRRMN